MPHREHLPAKITSYCESCKKTKQTYLLFKSGRSYMQHKRSQFVVLTVVTFSAKCCPLHQLTMEYAYQNHRFIENSNYALQVLFIILISFAILSIYNINEWTHVIQISIVKPYIILKYLFRLYISNNYLY